MTKSLRIRLILIFLFLGLLPAIIVDTVFYLRIEKREREIIYRDSVRLLESISEKLDSFFQYHTGQIETLANDQSITLPISLMANTEPNSSMWRTSLTTVLNSINRVAKDYQDQYLDLFATSNDYILFNPQATLTADDAPKDFIGTALATAAPTWSPWIWSEQLQTYLMFVTVPVYNITGDVVGTVGAAIGHAQLDQLIQSVSAPTILSMMLIWSSLTACCSAALNMKATQASPARWIQTSSRQPHELPLASMRIPSLIWNTAVSTVKPCWVTQSWYISAANL